MAALYWIVRERVSARMAIALAVLAVIPAVALVAVVGAGGSPRAGAARSGSAAARAAPAAGASDRIVATAQGEASTAAVARAGAPIPTTSGGDDSDTPAPGPTGSATTTAGAAADLAQADRAHEYPGPPVHEHVVGGWRTPVQAVTVFADTYINWTAATVSDRLRALGEVSVGQARSMVTLAAAETAEDGELHRGGVANSGVVEAVAALTGHAGEYVVVTRERTTATDTSAYAGLAPAWHVTLATVTPIAGGLWVLSAWQPES